MIHPIPSGTRDVLPDEMRELRAITERAARGLRAAPATARSRRRRSSTRRCSRAATSRGAAPAYRLFDEHGQRAGAALRHDGPDRAAWSRTRYADAEPPLRFCYFAHAYRGVRPQRGQPREFLQAGIELIGAPAPDGDAEALTLLCAALDAAGLRGLPHRPRRRGRSTRALLDALGGRRREARADPARARHARLRRARARGRLRSGSAPRRRELLAARAAAARRRRGAERGRDGPAADARGGPARRATSCWQPRGRRAA